MYLIIAARSGFHHLSKAAIIKHIYPDKKAACLVLCAALCLIRICIMRSDLLRTKTETEKLLGNIVIYSNSPSSEGAKRRLATEILIPNFVKETEIVSYIEDICHEWATENTQMFGV